MPSPSNIQLQVARNGGGPQTGGISAAYSDSCVLSLVDPNGVTKCLYEIYAYPTGFSVPGGWSTSGSGVYYYLSTGGPAPAFSLPAATTWGDYLLRATVNDGTRLGSDGKVVAAPDLIDARTALRILSPSGLPDVAYLAGTQFSAQRSWVGALQQWFRALDSGGLGGSPQVGTPYRTVRAATTANITLSGAQTIDGVSVIANDRVLVKNQSTATQNGIYVAASGAWSRATDFDTSGEVLSMSLIGVSEGSANGNIVFALTTDAPITLGVTNLTFAAFGSGTLATVLAAGNNSGANDLIMADGQALKLGTTNLATAGDLRLRNNRSIRWRNAANNSNIGFLLDGSDNLTIGVTDGGGANIVLNASATHTVQIAGVSLATITKPSTSLEIRVNGDNATGGLILSATAPTTGVAGRNVAVVGGTGGTGNQSGGNAFVKAGTKTGSGVDGLAGIQDSSGGWRVQLSASKELFYNAATTHTFQTAGASLLVIGQLGSSTVISSDSGSSPDGLIIAPSTPATNIPGGSLTLAAAGGGPGNNNGGDVLVTPGAKTGSGADGSAGLTDADSNFRVLVTPSRNLEYDAVTSHTLKIGGSTKATLATGSLTLGAIYQEFTNTSAPGTPSGACRVWAEAGALKAVGASGTTTTVAPAEPHCPTCGLDFALEWESKKAGKKLSLCVWCASADGGPLEGYVIDRKVA